MKHAKKKSKIKILNLIIITMIGFASVTLYVSLKNIIIWEINNIKIKKEINEVQDIVEIIPDENIIETEIIRPHIEIPKENPYWDYIKMDLLNVDFKNLKEKNNDVVGWIKVDGTNINYPFVQTTNNDYYLNHSFNKKHNYAGWVFLDAKNDLNANNKNYILYAHSRIDKTMFGSLKNILNDEWQNNTDNHIVKLSTEKENTLWQVISIYHVPNTSDYIKKDFATIDEFKSFLNLITSRSIYNFYTEVTENDQILTLSTCYNNDKEKLVLHAKLIKREIRK